MTTGRVPEPSNEELWAQPPAAYQVPPATPPAHLPVPQAPAAVPAPVPVETPAKQNHGMLALAITSLGVGVPLTAIAVSEAGLPGLVVAWIGIVGVNAAYAWSRRR
ncbi:MAG: hypothetical protein J0I14_09185 [Propionibacteriaceae bacterium]|nr:hypothetical protein [Propionibacteriaceae bacterium]